MIIKKISILVLILFLLVGCSLPLAHGFTDKVMPEDTVGRAVSAPFVLPVYLVLAGVDILCVNPVIACINLPDEIARAWNEDSDDPNQAKIITGKILTSPIYTLYLVGFIAFSEQFEEEEKGGYEVVVEEKKSE